MVPLAFAAGTRARAAARQSLAAASSGRSVSLAWVSRPAFRTCAPWRAQHLTAPRSVTSVETVRVDSPVPCAAIKVLVPNYSSTFLFEFFVIVVVVFLNRNNSVRDALWIKRFRRYGNQNTKVQIESRFERARGETVLRDAVFYCIRPSEIQVAGSRAHSSLATRSRETLYLGSSCALSHCCCCEKRKKNI